MDLRIISLSNPKENILFDQVLFERAEQGLAGEALRFWESETPFIVLGKTSKAEQEIVADSVHQDRIPVIRRVSAGGVVVQGKGCLNFTLLLSRTLHPSLTTISSSYEFILNKIILALNGLGVASSFYPPCDLALTKSKRKFSGNAQRRGKNFILHHGTMLHHFDIALATKYLQFPQKVPLYRKGRSHEEFMENIVKDPQDIIDALAKAFKADNMNHHIATEELTHLTRLLTNSKL